MDTLRTQSLTIGYAPTRNEPHTVAEDLELELSAGELVCLLGPNGIGKSTLMRTLSGLQPALSGEIRLGNQLLKDLTARHRAQRIGIVSTERIDVGHLSGYALVSLGRYPYTDWMGRMDQTDRDIVSNAIQSVGAVYLADRPVSELSDGERQKIMIARALAQETDIILLDEPTAFLDLPRRVEIVALLRSLAHDAGKAILLSTHDLDLALRNADRIWLMTPGQVETGIPESLVLNGAFENAFARDSIEFDSASGSFRPAATRDRQIGLRGTGLTADWTARALERIGFTVLLEGSTDSSILVSVEQNKNHTTWQLDQPENEPGVYSTLDDLLDSLRTHVPKPSGGANG
jgi:iron complex transport system ATP-binding protein